jgi:predicted membrane protein
MNVKKFLIGAGVVYASTIAIYTAHVVKKGKNFEKTLDRGPESLDDAVICGGKDKSFAGQTMQDLRLGAFCGGMQLDFSRVVTEKNEYHMDIKVISGGLNVIVPDNFQLKIVDSCQFGGIADNTVCSDPENPIALSVFADIKCGGINFENANAKHFSFGQCCCHDEGDETAPTSED